MITTHRLPEEAFLALARGEGDSTVIGYLRDVQHSKHVMLLHAIAEAANAADPASGPIAAFRAGYRLLTSVQAADPGAAAWLFGLPHIGGWAHDCHIGPESGHPADFGYLAWAAAAAAVRAGVGFEIDVPVRDGRVLLPGLGYFHDIGADRWARLCCDGERLTIGELGNVPRAALVPDDGAAAPIPHWQGTMLIRAVAEGMTWEVLLETADPHLDRYALPMSSGLATLDAARWRQRLQAAWEILVRHHGQAAPAIARGVSVIVPLCSRGGTDLDSATTQAAFGAIATSWPPDPVVMAETLVHEFQHLKLCGLMDLVPLISPCDERVYAPWRPDPRPASGLLQGVYAHLGVARFWDIQRQVESDPDEVFRAQLMLERWRPTIGLCTGTLLDTGCLTADGTRLVRELREQGKRLESETIPDEAREIAEQVALDHWLTWQLRHVAADTEVVADLAAAYQRGEPFSTRLLPAGRVEEETRKVDSTVRSRLLNLRYLEPSRYCKMRAEDMQDLSEADALLFSGQAEEAARAYRGEISAAADALPDAWIGLALAQRQLSRPLWQVFAARLPVIFDLHALLRAQGADSDPLALAAWFE